jgi:hypothetical protein
MAPCCERQLQGRAESIRSLLGFDTGRIDLPCAASVPNLMTDRALWVSRSRTGVDVRRLMYQTLICFAVVLNRSGDDPGRFAAPVDAKLFKSASDALVNRVRADPKANSDFLAAVVLVYQQKAFDLPLAETRHEGRRILHVRFTFSLAGRHLLHHTSFRALD